jgi:hypothetical protein
LPILPTRESNILLKPHNGYTASLSLSNLK